MAETVGTLVDKISIMELKIFHMEKQVQRSDISEDHRQSCIQRVKILKDQRNDLEIELNELTDSVFSGKKILKIYRQFKMYNDPIYKLSK
jgi:flagellar biosynthesis chaperone FliJ